MLQEPVASAFQTGSYTELGFTGSMLRGNFGHALKKTFCKEKPECERCLHPGDCGYSLIFEDKRSDLLSLGFYHPSPPFVFHSVPLGDIAKDHYLRFEFLALGEAAGSLLEYINCFYLMAENGFQKKN